MLKNHFSSLVYKTFLSVLNMLNHRVLVQIYKELYFLVHSE